MRGARRGPGDQEPRQPGRRAPPTASTRSFRVALTGTPVENRLDELWSQLHFTNPRPARRAHATSTTRYARPIAEGDADAAGPSAATDPALHAAAPQVARWRPSCRRAPRSCSTCELVDRRARGLRRGARGHAARGRASSCAPGGSVTGRPRSAAAPAPGRLPLGPGPGSGGARDLVVEARAALRAPRGAPWPTDTRRWSSRSGRACSIASSRHCANAGIAFAAARRLDARSRRRSSSASRPTAGPPVMLLSLKAGGTGLNLTAADHVFLLDPWWNPAVEDQAADRAHRIGQERPVMVHRLVARDTVEEGILALQERKRALADAALEDARRQQPAHPRRPAGSARLGHAETWPGPARPARLRPSWPTHARSAVA